MATGTRMTGNRCTADSSSSGTRISFLRDQVHRRIVSWRQRSGKERVLSPEFSVVIPTRGKSPWLRDAIASAVRGSHDAEVLVVHDRGAGHPAPDLEIATAGVRVLDADQTGPGGARNTGIDRARGRFVAFLDDDDVWLPDHLRGRARRCPGIRRPCWSPVAPTFGRTPARTARPPRPPSPGSFRASTPASERGRSRCAPSSFAIRSSRRRW